MVVFPLAMTPPVPIRSNVVSVITVRTPDATIMPGLRIAGQVCRFDEIESTVPGVTDTSVMGTACLCGKVCDLIRQWTRCAAKSRRAASSDQRAAARRVPLVSSALEIRPQLQRAKSEGQKALISITLRRTSASRMAPDNADCIVVDSTTIAVTAQRN